ncbi:MAG: divalent metal cation transporter [bacterium]|nr:divalent metal cation transporter [bacterium]MDO8496410.1 divalent metal cation transporter [bacterium]
MLNKLRKIWKSMGPGLITGASDDEPSGIATYTIAGAKFGLASLWMALFTLPLMIAIQEMSARIGRVSNQGLAGNMKKHYPKWLLFSIASLIVVVNTINIGADMSGMAQSVALILPFPEKITAIIMTVVILLLTVLLPYQKIFNIFKWLALSLFVYVLAIFTVHENWPEILKNLVIPKILFTKEFFIMMTAFFGTTIAPYLFFWQANQEVEEKIIHQCKPGRVCHLKPVTSEELNDLRVDTRVGMTFSNLITFCIIILTSSTLFKAGLHNVETLKDAAEALKPIAGEYSYLLFTIGIISSGFLAIPILAGSAAYVIAETFGWSQGLNKTFTKAKEFYGVIIASTLVGLIIPLLGFHPVKALFYTAILYGLISPIVIAMIIHMANNPNIMGQHVNSRGMNLIGRFTLIIMTATAVISLIVI